MGFNLQIRILSYVWAISVDSSVQQMVQEPTYMQVRPEDLELEGYEDDGVDTALGKAKVGF